MIAIRTKVTGLNELITANEKVMKTLDSGVFTDEVAKKSKRRAKYRGPRKSGKLVRQIDAIKLSADSFKLVCDATDRYGTNYPEILEFGLSRFIVIGTPEAPRTIRSPYDKRGGTGTKTAFLPFMRWAVWRTTAESEKIFKNKILKFYK